MPQNSISEISNQTIRKREVLFNMLVKDIGSCKDCPIYMKICFGNKDVLISHCLEPPCVYLNGDDDMEREIEAVIGDFVPLTKKAQTTTDSH